MGFGSGEWGGGSLGSLSDVDLTNPQNNDGLFFNSVTGDWENNGVMFANHPHQDVRTTASPEFVAVDIGTEARISAGGIGLTLANLVNEHFFYVSVRTDLGLPAVIASMDFNDIEFSPTRNVVLNGCNLDFKQGTDIATLDLNGTTDNFSIENEIVDGDISLKVNDTGGEHDMINLNPTGVQLDSAGARVNEFSTDGALTDDSDTAVPTEQAVKTYVDGLTADHPHQNVKTTASPTFVDMTLADSGRYNIGTDSHIWMAENVPSNLDIFGSTATYILSSDSGSVNIGQAVGTTGAGAVTAFLSVTNGVSPLVKIRGGAELLFDTGVGVDSILDDDTFATATDSSLATSESIKAYADTKSSSNTIDFASTNARFFGEKGEPNTQGWIEDVSAYVDTVTETVFGESKQVVRVNDIVGTNPQANRALTAQNWVDINAYGASYGGTSRLDTTLDGGFFSGLQKDTDTGGVDDKRYGMLFSNNGGYLRVTEPDAPAQTATFDGTGGNPTILYDEWFKWECIVPAGLGAAAFYVNDQLTAFAPTYNNNGGGGSTRVVVGSGSSGAVNRVTYHADFGVTIFEESATKTLVDADFTGYGNVQILFPDGRRDYTVEMGDGLAGRPIGNTLTLVANNVGGEVTLTNETPATGTVLFNGLRTRSADIVFPDKLTLVNIVDNDNTYAYARKYPTQALEFTYEVKRVYYSDTQPPAEVIEDGASWMRKDSSDVLYEESYVDGDYYSIIKGGP